MPTKQMPDNFDVFSEEYLDNNGIFKPDRLHEFRNQIAGHISYLNREKDARQFSQPVVSLIQTGVYGKEILNYNKRATQKLYSVLGKEIDNNLKALKSNPVNKAKISEGFDTLKKICNNYEYPKAKNACKKIISNYKKTSSEKIKAEKAVLKEQLTEYKKVVSDFKEQKKTDITNATTNENESPLMFRSGRHRVPLRRIDSVFSRLNNCSKSVTNADNLIHSATLNNPDIAQLKNKIAMYKQHISENTLMLKIEKNPETKEILKDLIESDNAKLQAKSKMLKLKIKKFTKVVKDKLNQTKKKVKVTISKQKKMVGRLKKMKIYEPEFEDKDLEIKIMDDIKDAVEGIELKLKEKEDKKQAKTMKKMEKEQVKLQKDDLKKAKQHAKTMKVVERQKIKDDKEFAKLQKVRETEFKKLDIIAKKEDLNRQKKQEKDAKEDLNRQKKENVVAEKRDKAQEKEREKRDKEQDKEREKRDKELNKEREKRDKELNKEREKRDKELNKEREKAAKAQEKEREKAQEKRDKEAKKTKKNVKGGKGHKRTRRYWS